MNENINEKQWPTTTTELRAPEISLMLLRNQIICRGHIPRHETSQDIMIGSLRWSMT